MNIRILASNIQYYRNERNWTQYELAEFMNVSRQAVSKWETGKSTPDLELLLKLSKLFCKSIDELIEVCEEYLIKDIEDIISVDKESLSNVLKTFSIEEILKALKGLSPEALEYICSIEEFADVRIKSKNIEPVKLSEVEIIHSELIRRLNHLMSLEKPKQF